MCGATETCEPEDCSAPGFTLDIRPARSLTLLLVIDDSGSMAEEQASLAAALPRLLRSLLLGYDEATLLSFPALDEIRLGVVTTDMGTGERGACGSRFGADGVLETGGDRSDPECMALYPTWLSFAGEEERFSDQPRVDAACLIGALGTSGCGFEQPLEAALKALTPSTSGITFAAGTVGHGDGQNAGFVLPDGVLAVVTLTDEDDCSTTDPALFDDPSTTYGPNLNLRCQEHADVLHPVERYVDGLVGLETKGLVYASIAGLPTDLVPDPSAPLAPQIDALLEDERMLERVDPEDATRLLPSCDTEGRGLAFPPRRIAELTARLGERGAKVVLGSICQPSYDATMGVLLGAIVESLGPRCLERSYERDAEGRVACELFEVLHPMSGVSCGDLPGRTLDRISDAGRSICLVQQLGSVGGAIPTGAGWYYDDFSALARDGCPESARRIAFAPGAEPAPGSQVGLDCTEASPPVWGSFCGRRPERCAEAVVPRYLPGGLTCDPETRTCLPPCESDADCLGGYRCREGTCRDLSCLER